MLLLRWLSIEGSEGPQGKTAELKIWSNVILQHCKAVLLSLWVSLVAQTVKNLPIMQEIWVWSLGQEDPLEKGMATHSIILACRIPWIEEPGSLCFMGLQRVRHDWVTNTFILSFHKICINWICCETSNWMRNGFYPLSSSFWKRNPPFFLLLGRKTLFSTLLGLMIVGVQIKLRKID